MNILITGGTGYISAHTAAILTENRHNVVLYDNLTNSSRQVLNQLNLLLGINLPFVEGDICDAQLLTQVIADNKINLVLHTAGLKHFFAGSEKPVDYLKDNIQGCASLLGAMKRTGVKRLIFSSSAAVYGAAQYIPIDESHPLQPLNDYGRGKLAVEYMLEQLSAEDPDWRIIAFRYFNVAGSHHSGLLRAPDNVAPGNMVSHMADAARGRLSRLDIFGGQFPSHDGTFVRDYIHVMDIADAHLSAVDYMAQHRGFLPINIGSGQAISVLDLVSIFERVTGVSIPVSIQAAAVNVAPVSVANTARATRLIGWMARRSIEEICLSEWRTRVG